MRRKLSSASLPVIGFSYASSTQIVSSILAIYIYEYLKGSAIEVGVTVSSFYAVSILTRGLVAPIASYLGTLPALLCSTILLAAMPTAYLLAPTVFFVIGARAVHGFAISLNSTTAITLSSSDDSKKKAVNSLVQFTAYVGMGLMVGPAIGAVVLAYSGIPLTFLTASIINIPAIGFCILLMRGQSMKFRPKSPSMKEIMRILRVKNLRLILASFLSFSYAYGVMIAYAPIYAKTGHRFEDWQVAILFFGYFTLTAVVRLSLGRLSSRFKFKTLVIMGLSIAAASLVLMAFSPFPLLFALGFIVMGIPHGLVHPSASVLIAESTDMETRFSAFGLHLACFDLGMVLGPILGSVAVALTSIPTVLALTAIVPILGFTAARAIRTVST